MTSPSRNGLQEPGMAALEADPSTAIQPIEGMFIADGEFVSANVSILQEPGEALHGPIIEARQRLAALSVFAPFFHRARPDIGWARDQP